MIIAGKVLLPKKVRAVIIVKSSEKTKQAQKVENDKH
jgi:hypothetical protein